jgi:F-type H+-transporting ATPase subunit a
MILESPLGTDTLHTVADTLHAGADTLALHASGGHEENLFTELLHHTQDAHELHLPFLNAIELPHLQLFGIDISITKHVVFLLLSALVLIAALGYAAAQNTRRKVPTGFGNLIEIFIVFVRDEIVIPNMGRGGVRYLPYLLTTFFFILVMNLFGMLPYGASATGNVNVTAGLAIIAFIMIQVSSIRAQGFGHYIAHLTGGVHWSLWPIMIPIEVLGLFTKPFALCIRLFANMTGGHIVIVALIGLIFVFKTVWLAPVSVGFVLGINFLELFVAFLQAYIFTMLTSLFMGLCMVSEHASEHADEKHAH